MKIGELTFHVIPSMRKFCLMKSKGISVNSGLLLLLVSVVIAAVSCDHMSSDPKTLLVYCGITMYKPISELAADFEKSNACKVIITKDGSGNLYKSLKSSQKGDLYMPGSESYIEKARREGLLTESVQVGYNKAAMMVRKGNPLKISSDLNNLMDKRYYVVIGNPDSGSIGKETREILKKKGIYDQVAYNAREMTTDSKRLVTVLKEVQADLVVNWYATSTWPENNPFIDVLPIDARYADRKKLVLGLLTSSRYPDLARKFMKKASSKEGRLIFDKYGLLNPQ